VIYESWKVELKNAARSLLVSLSNTTDFKLTLVSENLEHGIWRYSPPRDVRPHVIYDFGTESHGVFGMKGTLVYSISSEDPTTSKTYPSIHFTWDIALLTVIAPAFNSNLFSVEPRVLGTHSEIVLHFSSDELFVLEVKEGDTGGIGSGGSGGNGSGTYGGKRSDVSVEEKTGYGFET